MRFSHHCLGFHSLARQSENLFPGEKFLLYLVQILDFFILAFFFFFLKTQLCLWVFHLHVCLQIIPGVHRGQNTSNSLELGLQIVGSCYMGAGRFSGSMAVFCQHELHGGNYIFFFGSIVSVV